jgi:hypothetical protein
MLQERKTHKSLAQLRPGNPERPTSRRQNARIRTLRNWTARDISRIQAIRGELGKILPDQPRPFLPNWIRSILPGLKGAPLAVLCSYISHANRSGISWPAIATLCRETGYGHCAVDAARAFLVQAGILNRLGQEFNNGRRGKTKFQLTWHI